MRVLDASNVVELVVRYCKGPLSNLEDDLEG